MSGDSPANPHRGEQTVEMDGASYTLRPTFEAAVAIEEQLGSLLALTFAIAADGASLTLKQAGVVVTETMRAGGQQASLRKVTELLFNLGYPKVLPQVVALLTAMVNGGAEAKPGAPSGNG